MQARIPERIVEKAIVGMLPKNAHGRKLFSHLKVYKGPVCAARPAPRARHLSYLPLCLLAVLRRSTRTTPSSRSRSPLAASHRHQTRAYSSSSIPTRLSASTDCRYGTRNLESGRCRWGNRVMRVATSCVYVGPRLNESAAERDRVDSVV